MRVVVFLQSADLVQMETEDIQFNSVSLVTRLDNRVMDLRVSPFVHETCTTLIM